MLVTPIFPSPELIKAWEERMNDAGYADWRYQAPKTLREGVIVGGLNVEKDFEHSNKLEEYPEFSQNDFMIETHKLRIEANPEDRYSTNKLARYEEVPENVADLYQKDKFWHVWDRNVREWGTNADFEHFEPNIGSYGVVDAPDQLLELYDFESDPRKFFIRFTPMRKSEQSPTGGWRWHKWGDYYGIKTPRCEYLYDEPEIDEVWVYHIYQLIS